MSPRILLLLALVTLSGLARAAEGTYNDIAYGKRADGQSLMIDLSVPKEKNPPLLIWIHGGGWQGGDRRGSFFNQALSAGYAVASIDYRYTEEAPFPAQIIDCRAALDFLRAHASQYGYDANRIVLGGDSAGGHLSALLGLAGDNKELYGPNVSDASKSIRGVVDAYGPTDFTRFFTDPTPAGMDVPTMTRLVTALFGGPLESKADLMRAASPLTYVSPQSPPFLIIHGTHDILVPYAQSVRLKEALDKAGVSCELLTEEGGAHGNIVSTDPAFQKKLHDAFFAFLARVTK